MDFATTSGNGLRTCFPASWATSVPPPVTIVALSRRCCTGTVQEYHGATCRSASATGRIRTGGSAAGPKPAYGSASLSIWQPMAITNTLMIDSTIVRAHQHSAGALKKVEDQALGRSRGGLTTKIHALVDALGNPLRFLLTPGQAHDLAGADALLPHMTANLLIADRGFDADSCVLDRLTVAS